MTTHVDPEFPYVKCSSCGASKLAFSLTKGECDSCRELEPLIEILANAS